jgi:hypothetical protein
MAQKKILLPTTEKAFDRLIKVLVKKYKLPSEEHATAVVARQIMHLPVDQATTTLEYLGHCVLKNMAYQLAQSKGRGVQHRSQIDQLVAELTSDPANQQAMDHLEQAISDGSEYAKLALEKIRPSSGASDEPAQIQEG